MDQKKIGEFISEIRKEKNMTQKDLAEKLNVSINAVSKWERGICFMDISLLKPLSKILDISIAEIINAKRITNNDITEEIVEKTLMLYEKQKKHKKRKKIIISLIFLFIITLLSIFVYKCTLMNKINKLEDEVKDTLLNDGKRIWQQDVIHIKNRQVEDYYTFKDIKLENLFKNYIPQVIKQDREIHQVDDGKFIMLSTEKKREIEDEIDKYNLLSHKKFIFKNQLNNIRHMYNYTATFELENKSIFNSISSLKDYISKLTIFKTYGFIFDEYYNISIENTVNSFLVISQDDRFTYYFDDWVNGYYITFIGNYTLDETIKIIETVDVID